MRRVQRHGKLAADDFGHTLAGPDLAPKAVRLRSTGQQMRQPGELLGRQLGRTARATLAALGGRIARARQPLADSCGRHAECLGNTALAPTLAVQFERTLASLQFPRHRMFLSRPAIRSP